MHSPKRFRRLIAVAGVLALVIVTSGCYNY